MVYFFTLPMRGCIGASSDGISLSLVTCRGKARKGGGISTKYRGFDGEVKFMGFRTLEISRAAEIHIKEGQLEITTDDGFIYFKSKQGGSDDTG